MISSLLTETESLHILDQSPPITFTINFLETRHSQLLLNCQLTSFSSSSQTNTLLNFHQLILYLTSTLLDSTDLLSGSLTLVMEKTQLKIFDVKTSSLTINMIIVTDIVMVIIVIINVIKIMINITMFCNVYVFNMKLVLKNLLF